MISFCNLLYSSVWQIKFPPLNVLTIHCKNKPSLFFDKYLLSKNFIFDKCFRNLYFQMYCRYTAKTSQVNFSINKCYRNFNSSNKFFNFKSIVNFTINNCYRNFNSSSYFFDNRYRNFYFHLSA